MGKKLCDDNKCAWKPEKVQRFSKKSVSSLDTP